MLRTWGGGARQNFKPTNLRKRNFFTHIFQGFYLDFKLLFIVF